MNKIEIINKKCNLPNVISDSLSTYDFEYIECDNGDVIYSIDIDNFISTDKLITFMELVEIFKDQGIVIYRKILIDIEGKSVKEYFSYSTIDEIMKAMNIVSIVAGNTDSPIIRQDVYNYFIYNNTGI